MSSSKSVENFWDGEGMTKEKENIVRLKVTKSPTHELQQLSFLLDGVIDALNLPGPNG